MNLIVLGWALTVPFGLLSISLTNKFLFNSLNKTETIVLLFSYVIIAIGLSLAL